jgi:RsmE family RNA methyltransferase
MNLLLFDADELQNGLLRLTDRRAGHIINILGLAPGDSIKTGMVNGKTGTATVTDISGGAVELEVRLTAMPPEEPVMELVLALPRPIMLQRILKQATVLGVHRFHLIRSYRVQKSYFQASLLQQEKLREVLLEGLEQTVDTRLPEVLIHERFRPFIEDVVPGIPPACRLLAHPEAPQTLPDLARAEAISGSISLAVGPEGGWSRYEVERFSEQGYRSFSMGRRILHVDTAVVALLAQLQLLRELKA